MEVKKKILSCVRYCHGNSCSLCQNQVFFFLGEGILVVDARGHFGGIWILRKNGSNIITYVCDIFMDSITIQLTFGNESRFLSGLYASHLFSTRLEL